MSAELIELSNALAQATERAAANVVAVHAEARGSASGVVWRTGIIVTAEHALRRDEEIHVTLADGKVVAAKAIGRDPSHSFSAPFGFYDKDYPGWQPVSGETEKK